MVKPRCRRKYYVLEVTEDVHVCGGLVMVVKCLWEEIGAAQLCGGDVLGDASYALLEAVGCVQLCGGPGLIPFLSLIVKYAMYSGIRLELYGLIS